jgi:hypothetical protein
MGRTDNEIEGFLDITDIAEVRETKKHLFLTLKKVIKKSYMLKSKYYNNLYNEKGENVIMNFLLDNKIKFLSLTFYKEND